MRGNALEIGNNEEVGGGGGGGGGGEEEREEGKGRKEIMQN
jgi:hypothetical protein